MIFFIFCLFRVVHLAADTVLGTAATASGLHFAGPGPSLLGEAFVAFQDRSVASATTQVSLHQDSLYGQLQLRGVGGE